MRGIGGAAAAIGLWVAGSSAGAQSTAALCADPGARCGDIVSVTCLEQVERFGAGAVSAGGGQTRRSAACDGEMAQYRTCLQRVAQECGGGAAPQATGCDDAMAIKLWQDVKDTTNPDELEGLALACPNTAAARLAGIRAKGLRAAAAQGRSVQSAPARPAARRPGERFRDCPECPEMVVAPAGRFTMGSPTGEADRAKDESPQRTVSVAAFALSRSEVTRGEYAQFVAETEHAGGGVCRTFEAGKWDNRRGRDWRDPGFRQTDAHPAVCVSWEDAQSFIAWLNAKTPGAPYRLPSAAEWEYAARAGGETPYAWGRDPNAGCDHANYYDQSSKRENGFSWAAAACDDGYAFTAPAGRFRENAFGFVDMIGNVWEWTEDCWHRSYVGAPRTAIAWMSSDGGDCTRGGLRGGAWDYKPTSLRTANRNRTDRGFRGSFVGFRVARSLER